MSARLLYPSFPAPAAGQKCLTTAAPGALQEEFSDSLAGSEELAQAQELCGDS